MFVAFGQYLDHDLDHANVSNMSVQWTATLQGVVSAKIADVMLKQWAFPNNPSQNIPIFNRRNFRLLFTVASLARL